MPDNALQKQALFQQVAETLKQMKSTDGRHREAAALLKSLCLAKDFVPDFTVLAMRKLA